MRQRRSEELLLLQVLVVGAHVPVHQAVAVALDGGRLVVRRLVEQLRQRAVGVLHAHRGRLGERRRPLGRRPVVLHRHRHVRVLLGGDVVRAAGQLRLLALLPRVKRDAGQRGARQERQDAHQERGPARGDWKKKIKKKSSAQCRCDSFYLVFQENRDLQTAFPPLSCVASLHFSANDR